MGVLEWLSFIADVLMFLGDVIGLAVHVLFAVFEVLQAVITFIASAVYVLDPYDNLEPFFLMGISMLLLYIVKAIFGR